MAKIPVIKAVNLSKEFELGAVTVQALSSVNLEIYSGEFIVFFGPSGCGKSTLMSMVAGLQPPSSGQIFIRGEELSKLNDNQLADHRRQKIGMVFQAFNLITSMNVVENIALPLAFARIGKRRRIARAENLLEVVGMTEYKKHTPGELSGGQQQKIAIARSLVANPWIMLADEPTGNLDSKSANEVIRLLISLNRKSKRTVVLITHNPDYLEYADRIFYLKDGKVVDVKVNSKAKKVEEVESVEKLKDAGAEEDMVKKESANEDMAATMVAAAEESEETEDLDEEKPKKSRKKKLSKGKKSKKSKQSDSDAQPSTFDKSAVDKTESENTEESSKEENQTESLGEDQGEEPTSSESSQGGGLGPISLGGN